MSGPTGVGKSTLLGVVTGLVPRFTGGTLVGDVLLDGVSIIETPPRERAHVIGYVGQDPAAGFVTDTVEEELAYGMEQLGVPAETMRRRVEETLDLLGIAALRDRDLRTLSGGEQQRVAIGAVLPMHPRLLVLDEPTSALDPTAAEEVLATSDPARARPRRLGAAGRAPAGAGGPVRGPDAAAHRGRLGARRRDRPNAARPRPPCRPSSSSAARPAGDPLPLTVRDARRRAVDSASRCATRRTHRARDGRRGSWSKRVTS